ncbi:MAG TPA: portal protein, partial [Sphingomicrobium sp.]|nr:portal protein [Sphingomicrobium sp.]
ETLQKEGVLVGPFAGRRETEKLGPMIEREIDIMMRHGALEPLPDEVKEAGARPKIRMTNPLSRMARAEQVSGFSRTAEIAFQAAAAGHPEALDNINFDKGIQLSADVLGAPPSVINSEDEVAAIRQARSEKEAAAAGSQMAPDMADAALKSAKTAEIAQKLEQGGGLG